MFNLGGDDKEQLKENMEEIKELVNSEAEKEGGQPEPPEEGPEPDVPQDLENVKKQVQNSDAPEQENKTSERPSQGANQSEEQDNERRPTGTQNSGGSDMREDLSSIGDQVKQLHEDRGSSSQNLEQKPEGLGDNSDTLFLEVDDFNEVQEMVEEMKYLSREMKDLMGSLEDGVQEDRRLEGEAREVVEEFTSRREKIQSSIK